MISRFRILVIDDDPIFRNLVVRHLRAEYLVSVAADGPTGFEKAKEHKPHLVIIDYQMPGWDGIQTLMAFRKDRQLSQVKIVMLTSDATKETVLSAIKAGTDDYIIKNAFKKEEFLAKMRSQLPALTIRPQQSNATESLQPEGKKETTSQPDNTFAAPAPKSSPSNEPTPERITEEPESRTAVIEAEVAPLLNGGDQEDLMVEDLIDDWD